MALLIYKLPTLFLAEIYLNWNLQFLENTQFLNLFNVITAQQYLKFPTHRASFRIIFPALLEIWKYASLERS